MTGTGTPAPAAGSSTAWSAVDPVRSTVAALWPIMAVVLLAFLVIGLALPVLPLHVRDDLGYGPFVVGLVTGCQFAASLFSRVWAGRACDDWGPKRAVLTGLLGVAAAGSFYLASFLVIGRPALSVTILLAGRGILGAAEAFIMTGSTVWGLSRVGPANAGKVIAWIGTAMFLAFAASAPLGLALFRTGGFADVSVVATVSPLPIALLVAKLAPAAVVRHGRERLLGVVRAIWLPSLGAALSSIGFGAILTFGGLLFVDRGWGPAWLPFTAYASALIAARMLFGHLPDRMGGARVALGCAAVEAAGLAMLAVGPNATVAITGAALVGFGYALVFPGLGVEAIARSGSANRGVTMGAYTACLDLALGVTGPALGLVAGGAGLGAAFLAATAAVLVATLVAGRLLRTGAGKNA